MANGPGSPTLPLSVTRRRTCSPNFSLLSPQFLSRACTLSSWSSLNRPTLSAPDLPERFQSFVRIFAFSPFLCPLLLPVPPHAFSFRIAIVYPHFLYRRSLALSRPRVWPRLPPTAAIDTCMYVSRNVCLQSSAATFPETSQRRSRLSSIRFFATKAALPSLLGHKVASGMYRIYYRVCITFYKGTRRSRRGHAGRDAVDSIASAQAPFNLDPFLISTSAILPGNSAIFRVPTTFANPV